MGGYEQRTSQKSTQSYENFPFKLVSKEEVFMKVIWL